MGKRPNPETGPKGRDHEIYDLVVRHGWSQYRVAAKYGLTQSRISQICSAVDAELRQTFVRDIRTLKMRQTQQLEELYFLMIEAWRNSQGEITEIVTTATKSGQTISTSVKESAGNPAYVKLAIEIMDRIRELWGAELKSSEASGGQRRYAGLGRLQLVEQAIAEYRQHLDRLEAQRLSLAEDN